MNVIPTPHDEAYGNRIGLLMESGTHSVGHILGENI